MCRKRSIGRLLCARVRQLAVMQGGLRGYVLLQLTPLLAPLWALVRCVPRHLDLII